VQIKIVRNTRGKPTWKLADASIVFTDEDDPLLAGLVLSGFTIGTGRTPDTVNITLPSRKYLIKGDKGVMEERVWNYLRSLDPDENKTRIDQLLTAIDDAYHTAKGSTT